MMSFGYRGNQYAKSATRVGVKVFPPAKMGRVRIVDAAEVQSSKFEVQKDGAAQPERKPAPVLQIVQVNTGRGEECWVPISGPLFLGEALRVRDVIEMGWREEKAEMFARLDAARQRRSH